MPEFGTPMHTPLRFGTPVEHAGPSTPVQLKKARKDERKEEKRPQRARKPPDRYGHNPLDDMNSY
jgi:hypothetical protein